MGCMVKERLREVFESFEFPRKELLWMVEIETLQIL